MVTRVFSVEGMACPNCKARLESSLTALDGVVSAVASLENKSVSITFNSELVTPTLLQSAAEDAGYGLLL